MTTSATEPPASVFERRALRAEELARRTESAVEPLHFAASLMRAQGDACVALVAFHTRGELTGRLAADIERSIEALRDIARCVTRCGPADLAQQALGRVEDAPSIALERLTVHWSGERLPAHDYLSRAMLRPYLEVLRAHALAPEHVYGKGPCPFCGGAPSVTCRRDGSDADGAARFLLCALCGLEWAFARIRCPTCREEDPSRLPHFATDRFPHVSIEACETCRSYVKCFDLSEDAHPVPEVDDLTSLALDLWAIEQGFRRREPGLAGV